jgi:hypothetical protein
MSNIESYDDQSENFERKNEDSSVEQKLFFYFIKNTTELNNGK